MLRLESESRDDIDMMVVGPPLSSDAGYMKARFLPNHAVYEMLGDRIIAAQQPGGLWPHVWLLPDAEIADFRFKEAASRFSEKRRAPISPSEKPRLLALREQFAKSTSGLEIQKRWGGPIVLKTGPMGEAIASLDKCVANLLRDWGADPDVEEKIVKHPWSPDRHLGLRDTDYPVGPAFNFQESVVKFRLLVDAFGKVSKCASGSRYQGPEFIKIVCAAITRRAKFEPAELADGTKVPGLYVNRVVFRMHEVPQERNFWPY